MKHNAHDVAGVVVFYNSNLGCIANIALYINQVHKLFIIDNSESLDKTIGITLEKTFSNVHYHWNGDNKGVAFALNKAANLALEQGYKFLLTMDDDSRPSETLVEEMLAFLTANSRQQIGIVSVNHSSPKWPYSFRKVSYTMTSGNLLNLAAYHHVGPFLDKLFIDHVDHEYGLRLLTHGYEVIEVTGLSMNHQLGFRKKINFGSWQLTFVSHSPIRNYYNCRNGIYVARLYVKRYPAFMADVSIILLKELLKILFLEDRKSLRLRLFIKGFLDGILGKMGPYGN